MLTRDEILAVYAAGPEAVVSLVEQLQQALAALTARVEELENRLRKDSHNSHKPPSSDGLARGKKPKSLRGKSGKKSGGQPGHPGTTLRPVERPDERRLHAPAACAHCGSSLEEETRSPWTTAMILLLQEMKQEVEWARTAGATALSPSRLRALEARYRRILEYGSAAHPPPPPSGKGGRRKQSPSRNLLNRLATHRAAVLGFLYDFAVPFDNNLAERDLRMVKVQQKISGGFRSAEGALIFCRIRGYISTLRKQGLHVLSALQSVFLGSPLMPQLQG